MSDIVDFAPALRRKQQSECRHQSAEVDDEAASLTCAECGAELDPWWFLRRWANDEEGERERLKHERAKYAAWCETANETVRRLQREIAELNNIKSRLSNTSVSGMTLGQHRAVSRRRNRKEAT